MVVVTASVTFIVWNSSQEVGKAKAETEKAKAEVETYKHILHHQRHDQERTNIPIYRKR